MKTVFFCLVFFLVSCSDNKWATNYLDETFFNLIGGTVFTEVEEISLKEIHLKSNGLNGKEVIIEAELLEVGQHSTFMVVADSTARMLIVLTKLDASDLNEEISKPNRMVRVLGVIESKNGTPSCVSKIS